MADSRSPIPPYSGPAMGTPEGGGFFSPDIIPEFETFSRAGRPTMTGRMIPRFGTPEGGFFRTPIGGPLGGFPSTPEGGFFRAPVAGNPGPTTMPVPAPYNPVPAQNFPPQRVRVGPRTPPAMTLGSLIQAILQSRGR